MKTCTAGVAIGIAAWLGVPWEELFEAEEHDILPPVADSIHATPPPTSLAYSEFALVRSQKSEA
jgi:hypothetical protein